MVTTILGWAGLLVVMFGAIELSYRMALRRHWRLGPWTQKVWGQKSWDVTTRWGVLRIHGWCKRCGTSWKFVDPHIVAVNPYGRMTAIYPFCDRCHTGLPMSLVEEAYMEWWLNNRDDLIEHGLDAPDIREWKAIELALRIERSPERVAYA